MEDGDGGIEMEDIKRQLIEAFDLTEAEADMVIKEFTEEEAR